MSTNIYISSDFHLGHKNIVRGVTDWAPDRQRDCRGFASIEDMDETILYNINSTVDQYDVLYFLGDFSFGGWENIEKYRNRIVCKNIHLIFGNHDEHLVKKPYLQSLFSSCQHYFELPKGKKSFTPLMHFPLYSWNGMGKGYPHFHGHLHNKGDKRFLGGRSMDVGIDGHPEFKPYKLSDALDMVMEQPIVDKEHDHHIFGE